MTPVNVMKVAIMEIIGVAVVHHSRVPAIGAMDMGVLFVFITGFRHIILLKRNQPVPDAPMRVGMRDTAQISLAFCFVQTGPLLA